MFKFIKDHIEKMDHAQIYPIISLLIFFLFFVALLWYVKKMDKTEVSVLSGIPLDGNEKQ
ncbi:MAG: CcoQ/FixQ family Cbb3-type cytochrome c oxidase assembly chaperone [Ferruginibacter sp.]